MQRNQIHCQMIPLCFQSQKVYSNKIQAVLNITSKFKCLQKGKHFKVFI